MHALILAAVLLAAAPAAPETPAPAGESYYLVSFQGRTIGKAVRRVTSDGTGDAARVRLALEESYRFSAGDRPAHQFSLRRDAEMRSDWSPVSITEKSDESGKGAASARFEPGKAIFTLADGSEKTVEFKGEIVAEMSGEALKARGALTPGGRFAAVIPDLSRAGLVAVQAEVVGQKRVEGRAGTLLLVEVKDARGTLAWDMLVDENGTVEESSTGDMIRRRVERAKAILPDAPVALAAGAIPLENAPAQAWKLERLTVELTLAEPQKDIVPPLGAQQVSASGRTVTVTVGARRPDGRLPEEPLSAEAKKLYLTPENEPDYRDAAIAKLAAGLTRDVESDLKKGYTLGRWVYRNLEKNLGGPPEASAVQALAARAGDCSEHAALFAALARAAGVPARTAWGLVLNDGALRFHVWSEFHAGGRWVPVDAALGRFGLPACYITLGYDRDEAGTRLFKLYAASRGRVLKAEEKGN